ncbi:hydantoinase/oxoprolinase family protein [Brevibacterium sp. VCM10]|uniref:hydantoinase/oxoprolinase family protein n=1 Tax=Brevibacterium sp. VCM10 TaxID=1381751 RepID=UPI000472AFEF|nr:hydantoinase/oxoprolinase family protein [Brevibacterium sp. VCM10]
MIAVDVGGTFTDVVGWKDGKILTTKVSTEYGDVAAPVLTGAERLGVKESTVFNHASTHGLNAVITRKLPKIGFLATEGHRDILDMGRVWRPSEAILDPGWRRSFGDASAPLVDRYLRRGIRERMLADGEALFPLDEDQAREEIEVLGRCGVTGVAICLINAYVRPAHEERLRELVREILGDVPVSISSEVSPLAKEYARASTTVVDTLMKIIYSDYTDRLGSGLRELGFSGSLNFADCAATLVPAEQAMKRPFRIVFSGPAAGTVAGAHFGGLIGTADLLCADVGGTSCDISVVTGGEPSVDTSFELEHDLVVNALANEISSIGAGGGSIVHVGANGEILVGPDSARAEPGPACFGRGGTAPTTTDTCLMVGILDPEGFAGGELEIDRSLSEAAFESLDCGFGLAQRVRYAYEMAVHTMAEGLFNVTIKNGIDPRDYTLMAFGAAGPMLLPAVMDALQCKEVVVPPSPGLFSALGLLSADQVFTVDRSAYLMLDASNAERIDEIFTEMEQELRDQAPAGAEVEYFRSMDAHLFGQSWETPFVPVPDGRLDAEAVETMLANFHDTYEARSGNRFEAMPAEGVTFRMRAVVATDKIEYPLLPQRSSGGPRATGERVLRFLGEETEDGFAEQTAAVYPREELLAGDVIDGPAIINEDLSTTHIGAGQVATIGAYGQIVIRRAQ